MTLEVAARGERLGAIQKITLELFFGRLKERAGKQMVRSAYMQFLVLDELGRTLEGLAAGLGEATVLVSVHLIEVEHGVAVSRQMFVKANLFFLKVL